MSVGVTTHQKQTIHFIFKRILFLFIVVNKNVLRFD